MAEKSPAVEGEQECHVPPYIHFRMIACSPSDSEQSDARIVRTGYFRHSIVGIIEVEFHIGLPLHNHTSPIRTLLNSTSDCSPLTTSV